MLKRITTTLERVGTTETVLGLLFVLWLLDLSFPLTPLQIVALTTVSIWFAMFAVKLFIKRGV